MKKKNTSGLLDELKKHDEYAFVGSKGDRVACSAIGDPEKLMREIVNAILTASDEDQEAAQVLENWIQTMNQITGIAIAVLKVNRGEMTVAEVDRIISTLSEAVDSTPHTIH